MGYAGACTSAHFLYPQELETRNLLIWVLEKWPQKKRAVHESTAIESEMDAVCKAVQEWSSTKQEIVEPSLHWGPSEFKTYPFEKCSWQRGKKIEDDLKKVH